jgi:hypothetical protein
MLTTDNTQSVAPADPSLLRIDRLVARIQDTVVDSSGFRRAVGAIKTGTPGSPAPAVDPGEVSMGTVTVAAGGSPGPELTLDLADLTALGGVKPVASFASLPTVGRYAGMHAWLVDEKTEVVWDGAAWLRIASAASFASIRRVGTWTRTSNSAGFSSEAVIDTISNVPVVTGKRYRITWNVDVASAEANNEARFRIRETNIAGTVRQYSHLRIGSANQDYGTSLVAEWVSTVTGTRTWVGTCHRQFGAGTFTCNANANEPAYLTVDEIG